MLLSGSDLAYMKGQQALAMPDTCTLRAVTLADDGSGGWTEGTSDTLNVPCRVMMPSFGRGETTAGMQTAPRRDYVISVPRTYTLTPKMRVLKGGVTYEVLDVNEGVSYETVRRATLVRREI